MVQLSSLVWFWLVVQLAYWAIVYTGVRRFDRLRAIAGAGDDGQAVASSAAFQIVLPAYNENRHLPMIAANLAEARTVGVSAIVVDDGSSDGSTARLSELCAGQHARLLCHDINRGKSVALQTGLQAVSCPVALLVDADTRVSVDGARRTAMPREVGAVAFTIVAIENSRLAAAQACEYDYILNFERQALAGFGIVLTVPGSASLWRKEALSGIGGFTTRTEAEDTDATLALQAAGWKIAVSDVPADTDCPSTLRGLVRQRGRWIWGNLQAGAYAVAGAFGATPVATRRPAMVMATLGVINVLGCVAATSVIFRIAMLDLGRMDLVAAAFFGFATVGRIAVTDRMRSMKPRRLLNILASLLVMQMVNLVAFWHGGLRRVMFSRAW